MRSYTFFAPFHICCEFEWKVRETIKTENVQYLCYVTPPIHGIFSTKFHGDYAHGLLKAEMLMIADLPLHLALLDFSFFLKVSLGRTSYTKTFIT